MELVLVPSVPSPDVPDIWRATRYVVDGTVEKLYGGKRKIHWHEVFAGDKAFQQFGEYLPQETLDHLAH